MWMLRTEIDDLIFDQFGGAGIGERITYANHPPHESSYPTFDISLNLN
jgi:hypothetical protein